MEKYAGALEKGKDQARTKLEQQIAKRKERRRQQKLKELEATSKREQEEEEQREREERIRMNEEEAERVSENMQRAARPRTPTTFSPSRTRKEMEHSPSPEGELEKVFGPDETVPDAPSQSPPPQPLPQPFPVTGEASDYMDLLIRSPLFERVVEIETLLRDGVDGSTSLLPDGGDAYIDSLDAQWVCQGETVAVDVNALSPSHFVVYQFGNFIVRLLSQEAYGFPRVAVLLAANLPPNNYRRNAFRNSYRYQHKDGILFVRRERMENVGGFVLVVMHALAHVKVGDLKDDTNPHFIREFYKVQNRSIPNIFSM